MSDEHICDWSLMNEKFSGQRFAECAVEGCDNSLTHSEIEERLNKIERLDTALVMGDDEIHAYEWATKQLFQSVAADYARKLARYIKRVKIAYREQ